MNSRTGAPAVVVVLALVLTWACTTDRSSGDAPPPGGDRGPDIARKGPSGSSGSRRPTGPRVGATWQYQLTGDLDLDVRAEVFDVDGERTSAEQVERLHRNDAFVICYLSAGSYEPWRPDADSYPAEVLGRPLAGWPDERWVDVRATDVILPIIEERVRMCSEKGFDGVEFDNVDGWINETGLPLTPEDQLTFNRALAELAHRHGLAAGLKNNGEQVPQLVDHFDFAVVEECVRHGECTRFQPFLDAGKAVFVVEYEGSVEEVCRSLAEMEVRAVLKDLDLGPTRRSC